MSYSTIRLRRTVDGIHEEASINIISGRGINYAFVIAIDEPRQRIYGRATNSLKEAQTWQADIAESYVADGWERA
jgi:CRISPR/Cas system-associated exonuclease Cas4 (RecB family)